MSVFEGIDFSGFDQVGKHQEAQKAATGDPVEIALDQIIEDPDQPRRSFNEESLEGLAASIKKHGILQPIVVRPKDEDGKHVIVMGARRFRAARMAKLARVPAVIRVKPTGGYDQMVENIQRDNLLHADIARFIETELEKGTKATAIAASLGKPRSWVSLYSGFSQMHGAIRGRVEDFGIRAAYELHKATLIDADRTLAFLEAKTNITTREAEAFARELKGGTSSAPAEPSQRYDKPDAAPRRLQQDSDASPSAPTTKGKATAIIVAIFVQVGERVGRLMTDRVAEQGSQYGVVSFDNGADIQEISVEKMKLMEIISSQ